MRKNPFAPMRRAGRGAKPVMSSRMMPAAANSARSSAGFTNRAGSCVPAGTSLNTYSSATLASASEANVRLIVVMTTVPPGASMAAIDLANSRLSVTCSMTSEA